jgi:phosphopantothenoylcysteine decarboxylase
MNIDMLLGKGLACGDVGLGAMTEWREIVRMVVESYHLKLKADI